MALSEVTTTILDGALGLTDQDETAVSAAVGIATSGAVNTIYKITRPRDAGGRWTSGPLVEKTAYHIYHSKQPVYGCRVTGSVAGSSNSITKSNASGPTITKTGTPVDTFDVVITFTQEAVIGSASATGAFEYTVDGGDSTSPEIAVPVSSADLAQVTGTVDLTTSGLYGGGGTLNGTGFSVNVDGGGAHQVTFSSPANAAAVVAAINTAVGSTVATLSATNRLVISGSVSIVLAAGSPSGAITLLGLSTGTTAATAGVSTYVLGDTGITVTFPQGTYAAGDSYSFTTTQPSYSLSDLSDALDVFLADNQKQWFAIHVIGAATSAANARAMADLLDTYASDFQDVHRFMFFVMETPAGASTADLKAEFADFESTRVAVSFGYCELTSEATRDLTKRVFSRPSAWPAMARWASIPLSEKAAFVGRGKLPGVVSVDQDTLDAAEEMSDARFLAIREVIGKSGYFLAEDNIMAPPGSDFAIVPYRRIMDVACRVTRERLLNYLQANLLVNPTSGFIREDTARSIESDANRALEDALVNDDHASSAKVVVDRDDNLLTTPTLEVETRIVPPGYAKDIVHTIGFINPAFNTTA